MPSRGGGTTHRGSRCLEHASLDLIGLDALEQSLEVAFAEAVIALSLNELEEDRSDDCLGEDLQQNARRAAVHDALAIDEDAMLLHPLERLSVAFHAIIRLVVVDRGRPRHEFQPAIGNGI